MQKIGACYNFFDGEELLEQSICSIKNCVDYICIVYQKTSNYGNPWNPNNTELLNRLLDSKINEVIEYSPNLELSPAQNEINKRNIGLDLCRKNDCTHILGIDCDEFYEEQQFNKAKEIIFRSDYDAGYCNMWTYYKKPTYRINPPENYYVPFICKIKEDSKYIHNYFSPVLVDPTRRLNSCDNTFVFCREELVMHHYSFVRRDIRSKLENSSARNNFKNIEKYIKIYDFWNCKKRDFHPSNPKEFKSVIIVENQFGIEI